MSHAPKLTMVRYKLHLSKKIDIRFTILINIYEASFVTVKGYERLPKQISVANTIFISLFDVYFYMKTDMAFMRGQLLNYGLYLNMTD